MKKGFSAVLILLVIAAVSFGALAVYLKFKPGGAKVTPSLTSSTSQQADPTVYTDEGSASWKSYSNQEKEYLLKIPSTWMASDCQSSGKFVHFDDHQINCQRAVPEVGKVSVDVLEGNQVDKIAEDRKLLGLTERQGKNIGGKPAIDLDGSTKVPMSDNSKFRKTILVYSNNSTFIIEMTSWSNNQSEDIKTFDQILSTFRFTNGTTLDKEISYSIPQGFKKEVDEDGRINLTSSDYLEGNLAFTEKGIKILIFRESAESTSCSDNYPGISGRKNVKVGGLPAIFQVDTYEGYRLIYCINRGVGGGIWFIDFYLGKNDQTKYQKTIDQFVSAFKFVQ